jgi:hypothetical protein
MTSEREQEIINKVRSIIKVNGDPVAIQFSWDEAKELLAAIDALRAELSNINKEKLTFSPLYQQYQDLEKERDQEKDRADKNFQSLLIALKEIELLEAENEKWKKRLDANLFRWEESEKRFVTTYEKKLREENTVLTATLHNRTNILNKYRESKAKLRAGVQKAIDAPPEVDGRALALEALAQDAEMEKKCRCK